MPMGIIKASKLVFDYIRRDEENHVEEVNRAIDGLDLEIGKGDFVAILGHNGSGKSTFAKQVNGILLPTEGAVWVSGMDTRDDSHIWDIRKTAGMVFQNPDNQIIGNVVEEDVGFGPENLGVPTDEIWRRVDESLRAVGMAAYRLKSPNKLSGGQKQRVAIAGVMAMKPQCIILDEPTAMLDPDWRKQNLENPLGSLLHLLIGSRNRNRLADTSIQKFIQITGDAQLIQRLLGWFHLLNLSVRRRNLEHIALGIISQLGI